MENVNPLEKLNLLEQKFLQLVELLKSEKESVSKLTEEKNQLIAKVELLEQSMLKGSQNIEELTQERMLTKMVVDELITSIDKLVEHEQQ